ncbi:MAG: hypothetical protein GXP37_06215 [Chloroflexi bacterium]|nr:hypothetical protein [Chloroflexota bacterium]
MKQTLLLCLVLAGMFYAGRQPITQAAPTAVLPRVVVWMPSDWDADVAMASFRSHAGQIDEISPFWYGMTAEGTLTARPGAANSDLVTTAHQANILVIPTISNGFDPERVHAVLSSDPTRARHIQAIVYEVLSLSYDGIDIDYENLYATDRDAYSQFLAELAVALHAYDRLLSVDVQAKTSAAAAWDGVGALDYEAIGIVADEVRVMTYGWCWRTGCVGSQPPGPIAPVHWVRDVMSYAGQLIPSAKLIQGIPLYGYDWWPAAGDAASQTHLQAKLEPTGSTNGRALNWRDVQGLIAQYEPAIQWWESDARGPVQEHWFSYGDGHSVVYADRDSVGARWQLAQEMGVAGVALWYLGSDDPAIWDFLGKAAVPTPTPSPSPSPSPIPTGPFLPLVMAKW